MFHNHRAVSAVAVFAIVLVLLLAMGTFAFAQSGGGSYIAPSQDQSSEAILLAETVVPGGPAYYVINPLDFTPYYSTQPLAYDAALVYNPNPVSSEFPVPVHLPNGVTLNKLTLYYMDDSTSTLIVSFYECPLLEKYCTTILSFNTLVDLPGFQYAEFPIPNWVIDLQSNKYLIDITFPPGNPGSYELEVTGIRLDYGYPVSLPAVLK